MRLRERSLRRVGRRDCDRSRCTLGAAATGLLGIAPVRLAASAALMLLALLSSCARGSALSPVHEGRWLELSSTHVVLQTDLPEDEARASIAAMEDAVDQLAQVAFPSLRNGRVPFTVVLISADRQFRDLIGYGEDAFFTTGSRLDLEPSAMVVMHAHDYRYGPVDTRSAYLHELTHVGVASDLPGAPVWLNEGLARYFETLTVDGAYAVTGESHLGGFVHPGITPDAHWLLRADRKAFYGSDIADASLRAEHERRTYSGAWALVHMLRNGPEAYRLRFGAFVRAMHRMRRWRQAWDEAFVGVSDEALDADFRQYMAAFSWDLYRKPLAPRPTQPPAAVRPMGEAEVHVLRARLVRGPLERANAEIEQAARAGAPSADVAYWRGAAALSARDRGGAARWFEAVLQESPDDPRALYGLATTLARRNAGAGPDVASAEALDRVLVRLETRAVSAPQKVMVARWQAWRQRLPDALATAEQALAVAPNAVDALAARAEIRERMASYDAAEDDAERALSLLPDDASSDALLALMARIRKGRATTAVPAPPAP
jgi:tetratricopeptide (TPR) repeat protein